MPRLAPRGSPLGDADAAVGAAIAKSGSPRKDWAETPATPIIVSYILERGGCH